MTKKDFFGKLLSNRRNEPSPWDSEESAEAQPGVDVEEAPLPHDGEEWEESVSDYHSGGEAALSDHAEQSVTETDGYGEEPEHQRAVHVSDLGAEITHASEHSEPLNHGEAWLDENGSADFAGESESVEMETGGDGVDSELPDVSPSSQVDSHTSGTAEHERQSDELDERLDASDASAILEAGVYDESWTDDFKTDPLDILSEEMALGPIPHGSTGHQDAGGEHPPHEVYEHDIQASRSESVHYADPVSSDGYPDENPSGDDGRIHDVDEGAYKGGQPQEHPVMDEQLVAELHEDASDDATAAAASLAEPASSAEMESSLPSTQNGRANARPIDERTPTGNGRPADEARASVRNDRPTEKPRPSVSNGVQRAQNGRSQGTNGHAAHPNGSQNRESGQRDRPKGHQAPKNSQEAGRNAQAPKAGSQSPPKNGQAPKKPSAPAKEDTELRGLKDRVVVRMLQKQIVTPDQVKRALRDRNRENLKATLWRIVAQQNGVDRERVYREAALTYAFRERKLDEKEIDLEFIRQVADVFPEKRRNRLIELRVVPVGYEYEQQTQQLRVVFLTHDPSLPAVRALMQELNLERYELQYAPETVVKDLLAKAFPRKNEYLERMTEDPLAYDLGMSYEDDRGELIDEEALEAEINRSSLINLFEAALVEAVHKGASDIHIYPNARRQIEIHFRIDGRLVLWHIEDKVHPEALLAVIKDNTTNVDRFEREMAQDGFIQRKVEDTLIRYRVSILPIATAHQAIHAESIVIRVLDDRKVITDLSRLGLLKGALERFDMAIRQPHGMVILTGPTGSGKSTTLVAALHQVVNQEINTLTVEDPVEYIIPGVRQIKLNHKLSLEQALRAILRHDPDVVMVGEMRDRPTAELAIKLANTGHLTFSTLHTNDAPSAVSRLYKMGVEPFLIAYAINLVVAQRLIRSLCPACKVEDSDPDPVVLQRMGFTKADISGTTFYKAGSDSSCKTCKGSGYKGRRAISEALYFTRTIRHLIVEADTKIDEDELRDAARKEGMLTLQDSAREVVKMGDTAIDEMVRVTAAEE